MNILQPIDIRDHQKSDDGLEVIWGLPNLQKQFNDVIDYYVITCKGEDKTEVLYVEADELSQQAETNVTSTCSSFSFNEVKEVKLEFCAIINFIDIHLGRSKNGQGLRGYPTVQEGEFNFN